MVAVAHGVEQWVGRSLLSHLCAIDDWLAVALDSVLSPTYVSEKASFGRTAVLVASGLSMLEDAKQARTLVRGESSQSNL